MADMIMDAPVSESPVRVLVDGRVIANVPLCREHFRIDLKFEAFPQTEPGEFVQLAGRADAEDVGGGRTHVWEADSPDWPTLSDPDVRERQAMLRRPFSLAGRCDLPDGVVLSVIYRVVGAATDWLGGRQVGESVSVLGPMGNRFPKPSTGNAIFVGGGVGIPPLLYLADRWSGSADGADQAVKLLAICGATTSDLLPLTLTSTVDPTSLDPIALDPISPAWRVAEFSKFNVKSILATDDGSHGFHGLVTAALEQFLDRSTTANWIDGRPVLYTCGPEGMMKRVADIAAARRLECFIAVERAMACGMATCQSCVIRVRKGAGGAADEWRYALSCTEGPIFRGSELLW